MASRGGPMVDGTDGNDFTHRETVATHYQISALNKGRLRKCVFAHLLLALVMVVKLVPDFLDRLDIFILEIEELEVPAILGERYPKIICTFTFFLSLTFVYTCRISLLCRYVFLRLLVNGIDMKLLCKSVRSRPCRWRFPAIEESEGISLYLDYLVNVLLFADFLVSVEARIF
ncbi:unnamed protein product, partial [Meganyctiphanes norvegica]